MPAPGPEATAELRTKIARAYGGDRRELRSNYYVRGAYGIKIPRQTLTPVDFDPLSDKATFHGQKTTRGELTVELGKRPDDSVVRKVTFDKTEGTRTGIWISRVVHELPHGQMTEYEVEFTGHAEPVGFKIAHQTEVEGCPDQAPSLVYAVYKQSNDNPLSIRVTSGSLDEIQAEARLRQQQREAGLPFVSALSATWFKFSPSGEIIKILDTSAGEEDRIIHTGRTEHWQAGSGYKFVLDSNVPGWLRMRREKVEGTAKPIWYLTTPDASFAEPSKVAELNRLIVRGDGDFLRVPDAFHSRLSIGW